MKRHKQIPVLLAFSLLFSNGAAVQGHWADPQMDSFVQQGYLKGGEDGSLRPDEQITRAELCALINRVFSFSYQEPSAFSDVGSSDWFYDDINAAVANYYLKGYEDQTIRPFQPVTREECAVMLCKAMKLPEDAYGAQHFADQEEIAAWSIGSVGALALFGIVNGYDDGSFYPQAPVTRAEAVTMLSKACEEEIRVKEDTILERIKINKNIVIDDEAENISVTIEDVKSDADLIIYGRANTVTVKNASFKNIILLDSTAASHLILSDVKGEVLLQSAGKVTGKGNTPKITIQDKMEPGAQIILDGEFQSVQVEAPQIQLSHNDGSIENLQVQEGAKQTMLQLGEASQIQNAVFYEAVQITGGDRIQKADFYVAGSVMDKKPKERNEYYTVSQARPNRGGGGGGGSAAQPSSVPTPKPTQAPPEHPEITDDVPKGLILDGVTSNSANLKWDPVDGACAYKIYQEDTQIAFAEKNAKSLVLEPYTPYQLRVEAVFENGSISKKSEPVYLVTPDTVASVNNRMEAWNGMRLGIFLHWGGYSALEGAYCGVDTQGNMIDFKTDAAKGQQAEAIQKDANIPADTYRTLVSQKLTAQNYHPAELVREIKDAGMKYVVISAKDRDGLALFHSQAEGAWTAEDTAAGRDLLKEFTQEAKKAGLSVGFAYSQSVDWAQDTEDYMQRIVIPQIKEMLTYDIDSIWWEPAEENDALNYHILKTIRELDPEKKIKINNALTQSERYGAFPFDYAVTERIGEKPAYRFWEQGLCINNSKGYNPFDQEWKGIEVLTEVLAKTVGNGGNLLLHAGLKADGSLPEETQAALKDLGKWVQQNGEAVYETKTSPFAFRLPFGYATQKEQTIFLYAEQYPQYGILEVPGLETPPQKAYLLSEPEQELSVRKNAAGGYDIGGLPDQKTQDGSMVIALEFESVPQNIQRPQTMPFVEQDIQSGALNLMAYQAMLKGNSKIEEETASLTSDDSILSWNVRAAKGGVFSIDMTYACEAGGMVQIVLKQGEKVLETLKGQYISHGGSKLFYKGTIGSITLPQAGDYVIELQKSGGAMQFSSLSFYDRLVIEGERTVQIGKSTALSAVNPQGAVSWSVKGSAAQIKDGIVTANEEGMCTVTAVDEAGRTGEYTIWILAHAIDESTITPENRIDQESVLKIQSRDGEWTNLEQDITKAIQEAGDGIYRCEAWYRSDAPAASVRFFVGINDDWQERTHAEIENDTWKKVSFYIDVNQEIRSIVLKPVDNLSEYQEYPLYLGGICVQRLGSDNNLVINGNFEDLSDPVKGWNISENAEVSIVNPNDAVITVTGEHAVEAGQTAVLTAKISSLNQTANDTDGLVWSSDNEEVALVQDGIVTGRSAGTAVITVQDPISQSQTQWNMTVIDTPLNELVFEPVEAVNGNILQIQKGTEWSNLEQNFSEAAQTADGSIYKISICYRADAPTSVRMALQYQNDWNVPPVFTADIQWQRAVLYMRLPKLEAETIASIKPFDNINDIDSALQIAEVSIEKVGAAGPNLIRNGTFIDEEDNWSFAGAARSIVKQSGEEE